MNTEIAKIKGNAKKDWAYELNNGIWTKKKLVNNFGAKIGDWIKYKFEYTDGKSKVTDIIESVNIIEGIYINKYEIKEVGQNKFKTGESTNFKNLYYSTENSELFEKISKEIVKLFKWGNLTINKLRQYYQSIVNLYNAYERKNEKDFNVNELKTEFNLLLAKINYDIKRQGSKVPEEMYDFVKFNKEKIFENNNKVKEKFKIFRKHFETVVAYSIGELKKS